MIIEIKDYKIKEQSSCVFGGSSLPNGVPYSFDLKAIWTTG